MTMTLCPRPTGGPRPSGVRRIASRLAAITCAALLVVPHARAQQDQRKPQTIIRDAEIENLLREYINPVLGVAGLRAGTVDVILVGSRDFNAFVADRKRVFINVGTIMESPTPSQVIGVLAHETGHIAGGHLARLRQELEGAQAIAIIGSILGAAALVGAARGSQVGVSGSAPAGLLLGGQELALRSLLQYQRGEEQAADRAAITYLNATKQTARGMLETFAKLADQTLFATSRVDRYLLSHPLPRERIANLESEVKASPYFSAPENPAYVQRHALARAKLFAFVGGPDEVSRRYPLADTSLAAQYARAISAYRFGRIDIALAQIDRLIGQQPNNAYFHELRGQALLEAGRAREALPALRRAAAASGSHPLIMMMLGHALVSAEDPKSIDEAIKVLSRALQREPDAAEGYRYLAIAYDKRGDVANAELAAARGFMASGEVAEAQRIARRAQGKFKEGSPGWLGADDILNAKPPRPR